ncbi:ATP-binding cassette domain-containing protein [Nonomuraea sp. NPDC050663]|uniref:ATP-binding cassette domain-containing protein n=1 Tax=Nonomuraea sp. NPDC050663 TaxID=3364370 RepID=UPI003797279D
MIEVSALHKSFGPTVAVEDVSFTVAPGTVLGLLGPNGAGKTTVINCLTTLLRPDHGRALVAGHDVLAAPARVRENIAVTGQFAAVDELLSGRENLVLFARLQGLSKSAARARAEELTERFGLAEAAGRKAGGYSGGMRRRLDLAAALVVERPVLFLDEPTTGLDPRGREALWSVVRELRGAGTTILLTTQYLEEADQLADGVVVIDHGRVIASGAPEELKERVGGTVCVVHVADRERLAKAAAALGATPTRASEDRVALGEGSVWAAEVRVGEGAIVLPGARLTDVVRALDQAGIEPDDVLMRRPTLDDVFFALTESR